MGIRMMPKMNLIGQYYHMVYDAYLIRSRDFKIHPGTCS